MVEVLGLERRRRWSLADKERIVAESLAPGASVSRVARRYELHPSQVFCWRRQLCAREAGSDGAHGFLPVSVEPAEAPVSMPSTSVSVEISLSNGTGLSVPCSISPSRLAGIAGVLSKL